MRFSAALGLLRLIRGFWADVGVEVYVAGGMTLQDPEPVVRQQLGLEVRGGRDGLSSGKVLWKE